jgi:DNA-directed RNA polymerase subunit beta'
MLQKVRVLDPGDTTFLFGQEVTKKEFYKENRKTIEEGGKPAKATPILLGITKASLATESFMSAASFQDTTRVLTDAASGGKKDFRRGHKESIIMGQLIPSGTGFKRFCEIRKLSGLSEEEGLVEEGLLFDFS